MPFITKVGAGGEDALDVPLCYRKKILELYNYFKSHPG